MAKRRLSLLLPPSPTNQHNSHRHTQTLGDSARARTRSTRRRVDFSDASARARHASRVCTYVYCVFNSYYSIHKIHILRITYNMYDVYVHVHIMLSAFVLPVVARKMCPFLGRAKLVYVYYRKASLRCLLPIVVCCLVLSAASVSGCLSGCCGRLCSVWQQQQKLKPLLSSSTISR